ncbi:unnamed protein product [Tuber aestivum]|uniref:Uncharacterized protein n=1 Tax=Tuber aestivum TaxID=59557 RepID=A0A292Q471_9PEZI|nr:unnamed protein product [Tuber aestivum]
MLVKIEESPGYWCLAQNLSVEESSRLAYLEREGINGKIFTLGHSEFLDVAHEDDYKISFDWEHFLDDLGCDNRELVADRCYLTLRDRGRRVVSQQPIGPLYHA